MHDLNRGIVYSSIIFVVQLSQIHHVANGSANHGSPFALHLHSLISMPVAGLRDALLLYAANYLSDTFKGF